MIQLGRDLVHRASGKAAAHIDRALVRVQAGECRQQRRVNVQQTPRIPAHKLGRQNAHESCQHHQGGRMAVNSLRQSRIKRGTVSKRLVINHRGGYAVLLRPLQPARIGLVADDGGHARAVALLPVVTLGGLRNGRHIGAIARNEDDDVAKRRNHARIIPYGFGGLADGRMKRLRRQRYHIHPRHHAQPCG